MIVLKWIEANLVSRKFDGWTEKRNQDHIEKLLAPHLKEDELTQNSLMIGVSPLALKP